MGWGVLCEVRGGRGVYLERVIGESYWTSLQFLLNRKTLECIFYGAGGLLGARAGGAW